MLSLRRRGQKRLVWYIRGTVKVGKEKREVAEFSTGFTERAAAESFKVKFEADTQREIIFGAPPVASKIKFEEAALQYLSVARHSGDESRVNQLTNAFAGLKLAQIDAAAFEEFLRKELPGRSPNTHERARVTLASVFKAASVPFPKIPAYGETKSRVKWLSHQKADRLLRWYNKRVQPIALVARDCGLRASENLLMTVGRCDHSWGAHGAFHVANPKNGRDRVVPWTAEVRADVLPRLIGRRDNDRLWIGARGPYSDTRMTGGNPVTKAHRTACRDAGITDFTWHDWRHHWATWALQPKDNGGFGWSLLDLAKVGGWEDLESVQRYAAVMLDSVAESYATSRPPVGTAWAKAKRAV